MDLVFEMSDAVSGYLVFGDEPLELPLRFGLEVVGDADCHQEVTLELLPFGFLVI